MVTVVVDGDPLDSHGITPECLGKVKVVTP